MKKIVPILIIGLFLISSCSTATDSSEHISEENTKLVDKLKVKEKKIKELTQRVSEFEHEKDLFPLISNLSREFVYAHTTGDKKSIQPLLHENISLEKRNNGIYAIVDGEIEWLLFSEGRHERYVDWVLQGFGYDESEQTYIVHIREFYKDEAPPTFLNLTFKKINDKWKIINLSFDV